MNLRWCTENSKLYKKIEPLSMNKPGWSQEKWEVGVMSIKDLAEIEEDEDIWSTVCRKDTRGVTEMVIWLTGRRK